MFRVLIRAGLALVALGAGLAWLGSGHGVPGAPVWGRPLPVARLLNLPQWGLDILASPAATSTITTRTNISLAVNPLNGNHVLMAYNSDYSDGTSISAYAQSTDGGQSWRGGRFTDPWYTDNLVPYGGSDVAFDSAGTIVYAGLGIGNTLNGYFVLTSTTNLTWNTAVPVVTNDYNTYRDQGRLAIDQRVSGPDAGSMYLFTRYFDTFVYGTVVLQTSRDGGHTWITDQPVSDPGRNDFDGLSAAVAGDGTVYAAFAEYPRTVVSFFLDRSTDGGRTWGPDQLITGAPITKTGTLDYKGHRMSLVGDANGNLFLINTIPQIAVAPDDPATVYVAWNDGRWDQPYSLGGGQDGYHGDIAFTRTTDGGQTWSAPLRVNDDALANGVDQFQPSITAGPGGRIGVSWYDRRDDPAHFFYATYYSQSTDGGLTWSANQRVGDVLSDPLVVVNGKGEGMLGEYSDLAFGAGYVLAAWIDGRGPMGRNVYVDRGLLITPPPPTPSPSPVTATPSRTPSATPTRTPPLPPSATASPTATPAATPCALTFADVPPEAFYAAAVRCLVCRGVVVGYPCGGPGEPCPGLYYRPGSEVTRGQISKIISNAAGYSETPTGQTFADVPPGSPFYLYIERIASRGIVSGYPCGGAGEPCIAPANRPYFRPGLSVTRGQLAKIVTGAAGYSETPTGQTFADVPPGSPFYLYIERIASRGIVGGYPCGGVGEPCVAPDNRPYFRPNATATRGQMAKIAANTFYPGCQTPGGVKRDP